MNTLFFSFANHILAPRGFLTHSQMSAEQLLATSKWLLVGSAHSKKPNVCGQRFSRVHLQSH